MKNNLKSLLVVVITLTVLCVIVLFVGRQPDDNASMPDMKRLGSTTELPDFNSIADLTEKKTAFFNFLRPIISDINHNNMQKRSFVMGLLDDIKTGKGVSDAEQAQLSRLAQEFQVDEPDMKKQAEQLLKRIDLVPESLVLVQAATESGWGGSRFAQEGLNLFGQWCYTKGCGMIPNARQSNKSHEVTVFTSVEEAIASYMNNLNIHPAYQLFRSIRAEQRAKGDVPEASELAYGLVNYSERREAYVRELLQMLKHNKKYLEA